MTPDATWLSRRHLDRKTPWRLVKKYCRAAGIDPDRLGGRRIGIHSLRKTAINAAIRNGISMHEAREFAGHADIRTTEVYFVRREEDAEVAVRRIQIRLTGRNPERAGATAVPPTDSSHPSTRFPTHLRVRLDLPRTSGKIGFMQPLTTPNPSDGTEATSDSTRSRLSDHGRTRRSEEHDEHHRDR